MITLPDFAVPNNVQPVMMDFGSFQEPSQGGPLLRINRPGNRFAINVTLPPMDAEQGDIIISRLLRAKTEGLRMVWPLGGKSQSPGGKMTVSGNGQGGTTLNVTGGVPGQPVREGYWASLEHDGQHYLYNIADNVRVKNDGSAALTLTPPLRTFANEGDVLNFNPVIEGAVEGDEIGWQISVDLFRSIAFTIKEAG